MIGLTAWVLSALVHVAPWMAEKGQRAEELTEAIASAAATREEAAVLVSLAWWESGRSFDASRAGDHGHSVSVFQLWVCPGVRCAPVRGSERVAAREALAEVRRSLGVCRRLSPENRLAQYTTGRCQTNREARLRWGTAQRLLREVPWSGDEEEVRVGEFNRLVVWDPRGEYWEGSLIEEQTERALAARGVVTLPVDPGMFAQAGVGGYFKRGWGAGWPLDVRLPSVMCPLTLYIPVEHRMLHWRARLVPDARRVRPIAEGQVAFTSSAPRGGGARAAYTPERVPITARELGLDHEVPGGLSGWTLEGRGVVGVAMEGYYEFALYGTMPGLSVAWVAASSTPR